MVVQEILKEKRDMFCSEVLGCTTEVTQDRELGFIFVYEIAIHSRILACKIPWTEEPGGLQALGVSKSQTGLRA